MNYEDIKQRSGQPMIGRSLRAIADEAVLDRRELISRIDEVLEWHVPHPKWRQGFTGGAVCEECSVSGLDYMVAWPCDYVTTLGG